MLQFYVANIELFYEKLYIIYQNTDFHNREYSLSTLWWSLSLAMLATRSSSRSMLSV